MELPKENGANVASAWQPMSALMCIGPISRCTSLSAANTGRSGQPMQKLGGRGGKGAPSNCCASSRVRATSASSSRAGSARLRSPAVSSQVARPANITSAVYSPATAIWSLPFSVVCTPARRSRAPISCSMKSGWPSSTTRTLRLPRQKPAICSGTSGTTTFSTSSGMRLAPSASARPNCCKARIRVLVSPPWSTMPRCASSPGISSLRPCAAMYARAAGKRSNCLRRSWPKVTGGWANCS